MKVKINPNANFFGCVFGADCFVKNFPKIELDGIEVKLIGEEYYVIENGKPVHDTAFFTKEEMKHLTIIED